MGSHNPDYDVYTPHCYFSVGRPMGSHNPDNDVYDPGGDHALCHIRVPGKHQLYCTLLENVTNE